MVERYDAVGAILKKWYRASAHFLRWPDELMQPASNATMSNDASAILETEWEKDWIDIGGEG